MSILRHSLLIAAIFLMVALPSAVHAGDQDLEDEYDNAWHIYNSGRIEKAIQLFQDMAKRYPGNSRLYLTLGTIYLEQGDNDKAEDELRNALLHDPTKDEAIWANARLGIILLNEGTLDAAERHFRLASVKGADPKALFEVARGRHRIQIQHFLEGRFESGRFLIHYFPFGAVREEDLKWLASRFDESYKLANRLLRVETRTPIEIYLYPNVQSFINFFSEDAPTVYPEYGEIHEILDRNYDYLEVLCPVLLYRLQVQLNRHGTDAFVKNAIPHLVRGEYWGIRLQNYIYALSQNGLFVDLKIFRHPSYYPMVDPGISGPEAASFIGFLYEEYNHIDIRQFITQANLEALYGLDVITAQKKWLAWVRKKQTLSEEDAGEIDAVLSYVRKFDRAQFIPDDAMESFKTGLALLNEGREKEGEDEIKGIIEDYPDFGLAYYALGRLEFNRENYENSRTLFEKSLDLLSERGSSWGWAHYNLGHIAEVAEDYVTAKMHFERALESEVPNEVLVVGREKLSRLAKVADIAPSPGGEFEPDDLGAAVSLFSMIDLGLLNGRISEMGPYFATELNAAAYTDFVSVYEAMMAEYNTPIMMHQVAAVQSIGDFVRVKVILKLEVPKSEQGAITRFDEYLKLRRGKIRYFLLLNTDAGLRIVEFADAPSLAGRAKVLEEGGTIIPLEKE